ARGLSISGGNEEREQTLNQLLTEMDGFEKNDKIIILGVPTLIIFHLLFGLGPPPKISGMSIWLIMSAMILVLVMRRMVHMSYRVG
ncbi:MAG: hypothetical protein PHV87_07660, partial [Bacilli bacterium]|nr:hypothetical protein [Bacilli bacterium]